MSTTGRVIQRWTPEEEEAIRRFFPKNGADYLVPILGRSRTKIYDKARRLGVKFTGKKKCTRDPQPGDELPWPKCTLKEWPAWARFDVPGMVYEGRQ